MSLFVSCLFIAIYCLIKSSNGGKPRVHLPSGAFFGAYVLVAAAAAAAAVVIVVVVVVVVPPLSGGVAQNKKFLGTLKKDRCKRVAVIAKSFSAVVCA